jgi:serine/threonine protein kinase
MKSASDIRPDLPSDLARIIRRCLEKDPRHRVQTARRLFAGGSPSKVLD